jgi:hypothetical protein
MCGKVHRIKAQYAGMRGRCPTCSTWMYVPRHQVRGKPPEPPTPPTPPARLKTRFGKAAAFWLALGMLSLAVLAATPLLRGSTLIAEGPVAALLSDVSIDCIQDTQRSWVVAVPLSLILLPLAALLAAWRWRTANLVSRSFTYLAALGSTALALLTLHFAHQQYQAWHTLQSQAAQLAEGELVLVWGPQLPVAVAASGLAALAFVLAAFALHRRWWSRVLVLVLLGAPLVSGALWVLRPLWLG